MHIAITGASGLIGKALTHALLARGDHVSRLVRGSARDPSEITWRPLDGLLDPQSLATVDAVINLAGESVAERWTDARKAAIRDSRVFGTRTLVDAIALAHPRPRALLSASAVGYYGTTSGDALLDESTPPGDDFLASVCSEWEAEAQRAASHDLRVVPMRLGVVLAARGGALAKMMGPFKAGVGGKVGSGRQYTSWIALSDVVAAMLHLLDHPIAGPANLVAAACTQAELADALGRALSRPTFMRVPSFAIKALYGEMGSAMLLSGQRVTAKTLRDSHFRFAHEDLLATLQQLLHS